MDIGVPAGKDSKVKIQRVLFFSFSLHCTFNVILIFSLNCVENRNRDGKRHGYVKLNYS